MKELLQNKQLLFTLGAAGVLTIIVIIIGILLIFEPSPTPQPLTPSPTKVQIPEITPGTDENDIEQSKVYRKSFEEAVQKEKPMFEKDREVGKLLNKLPYVGTNFRMEYSYSQNQFTVIINNENKEAGATEFNKFLQENNIEEQNWIKNLQTTYQ